MIKAVRLILALFFIGSALVTAPVMAQQETNEDFYATWSRTDGPIALFIVERTWMWGPAPYSSEMYEPYLDSPGGERLVQYFDKSRMEINDPYADSPSEWYVTNGLLAWELITGRVQVGDDVFEQREPASQQVAGDAHPESLTYADLYPLLDETATSEGATLTQRLNGNGTVEDHNNLAAYDVHAAHYVPETGHTVAGPFWEFMNSTGTVYINFGYHEGRLFANPFYATGLPITEAYWVHVPVAGDWKDVLVECFERRCLTFTPDNSPDWQVEAGNIGQHYYLWRYGSPVDETFASLLPPGISGPAPLGAPGCVSINEAGIEDLMTIVHIDHDIAEQVIRTRPHMYLDSMGIGTDLTPSQIEDIYAQGVACV